MILLLILILIICFFSSNKEEPLTNAKKGEIGETSVKSVIKGTIEGTQYVLNDITIKDKYGNKAQIDHVVINHSGVHVIETKNWSGKINGNINDKEWVQSFKDKSYRMYNPIRQNNVHINRLKDNLGYDIPMFNIVCFTNKNVNILNVSSNNVVCSLQDLKSKVNQGRDYLSNKQMESLYFKLREGCIA